MRTSMSLLLGLLFLSPLCAEEHWNQFRGAKGDGKATATGVPAEFGEEKNVRWKTAIHGKGWSSPVVWGDQIWMTTAPEDGKVLYAVCVDLDSGKIVHNIKVFDVPEPEFCHPTNSYASPTPFLEEGKIYVHFGTYGTACLETKSGKKLWERRDLHCDHFRGPGSSPIIDGDSLFVAYDGVDVQFVVALNKKTGETIWTRERDIEYGTDNGDRMKAYSTASVIEYEGRRQLISPSAVATICYAPETGKELWRVRHGGMNAAPRPIFDHGLVYITGGSGDTSLVAVRPNGSGDITGTHIEWSTGKSTPKRSSQIILGDLMFMMSDSGVASCLEAKTGELVWTKRLSGEYWASPVYADGKIFYFSKKGKAPVVAASRDYQLLAENEFDAGFNASPAFAGNAMIVRTFTHLYRIENK